MSESYKLKGTKSQYESTNVYNRAMKLMNAQKSSVSLSKPHGLLLATWPKRKDIERVKEKEKLTIH